MFSFKGLKDAHSLTDHVQSILIKRYNKLKKDREGEKREEIGHISLEFDLGKLCKPLADSFTESRWLLHKSKTDQVNLICTFSSMPWVFFQVFEDFREG